MTDRPRPLFARKVAGVVTVPALVLGVDFLFHTSPDGAAFGKYSWGYFAFPAVWWLLVTPLVFWLTRWVFETQVATLPSGRTLALRPSAELLGLLVPAILLVAGVRYQVNEALGRGVATPHRTDVFHPYLQNTPRPFAPDMDVNRWGLRGAV